MPGLVKWFAAGAVIGAASYAASGMAKGGAGKWILAAGAGAVLASVVHYVI